MNNTKKILEGYANIAQKEELLPIKWQIGKYNDNPERPLYKSIFIERIPGFKGIKFKVCPNIHRSCYSKKKDGWVDEREEIKSEEFMKDCRFDTFEEASEVAYKMLDKALRIKK